MNTTALDLALPLRQAPTWLRTAAYGYLYWLVFLLVLEPGNVLHAYNMRHTLDVEIEVARIGVAALLGASVSPLLVALARRFPLPGPRGWRNAAIHVGGAVVLAFVLIVISCFLAAWILRGDALPKIDDVLNQLAANWLLLIFAISAFIAISHVAPAQAAPSRQPTRVAVKTRGRLSYVDIDGVEWIESQGNYLALHVGSRVHLIRETLANFERRLDSNKFVRIHRRMIVALDRIREVQPLANGDSTLILQDGRELRGSRSYREVLRERWLRS
jgi:two-component system LytT family response regulator